MFGSHNCCGGALLVLLLLQAPAVNWLSRDQKRYPQCSTDCVACTAQTPPYKRWICLPICAVDLLHVHALTEITLNTAVNAGKSRSCRQSDSCMHSCERPCKAQEHNAIHMWPQRTFMTVDRALTREAPFTTVAVTIQLVATSLTII
jgi:hypothetical protein